MYYQVINMLIVLVMVYNGHTSQDIISLFLKMLYSKLTLLLFPVHLLHMS